MTNFYDDVKIEMILLIHILLHNSHKKKNYSICSFYFPGIINLLFNLQFDQGTFLKVHNAALLSILSNNITNMFIFLNKYDIRISIQVVAF